MSERITFKNLLQLVEKETGLSNRDSEKLIRRWFNLINEGLERDGRVRILKLGTFKLRNVKERKGVNPRTRESLLIPSHTKVVFNSAKNLKEHVNKKYNLLEAKAIVMSDEKKPPKKVSKNEKNEPEIKKGENEIDDLISQIKETPEEEKNQLKYEETPTPVKDEKKVDNTKKKDTEEIRAEVEEKFSKKEKDFTPTGVKSSDSSDSEEKEKTQDKKESEVKEQTVSDKGAPFENEKVEVIVKKEEEIKEPERPVIENKKEEEKKNRLGLWIALAAIIILMVIVFLFWNPWESSEEVIVDKPEVKEVVKVEPPKPIVKKRVYKTPGGDHGVDSGDKLWDLSESYYKDAYLWPNIYRVNDDAIPNPDILVIGEVITVPPLEGTFRNLTSIDSVNISIGFYKAYEAYKKYGNQWAKYYLWVCKKYDIETFKKNQKAVEEKDYQFALSMK